MTMKDRDFGGSDERLADLFVPDTLLPSQYFDRIVRHGYDNGERRLMLAVLEDAVEVYRKQVGATDPRGRQLFEEADEWIENTDPSWLFSFQNICDVLGIEAEYIRRGLHGLKERARKTRTSRQTITLAADEPAELCKASG